MRKVATSTVKPGMKLAKPITDSFGRVLINAEVTLDEKYINLLEKFGFSSLYIEDGIAPDLVVEDVIPSQLRHQAIIQVKDIMSSAKSSKLSKVINNTKKIAPTVEAIIEELISQKSLVIDMIDIRSMGDYVFGHSVNTCVLALMTGISLGYSRGQLFYLGLSTIFHDIGMSQIPDKILNKAGNLDKYEMEEIKKHTLYGYEMIKKTYDNNPIISRVAYEHHERFQGQGYPNGLKGEEISEFARLVAVADSYDALTTNRVYRKACYPHEAFEILSGSGNFLFDFRIVQAFLSNIAAYPTGSLVELSTGETGIVVTTKPSFPSHPVVRILRGPSGEHVSQYEIDLSHKTNLVIKRVIEE